MLSRRLTAVLVIAFVPASLSAAGFYLGAGIGPKLEAGVFRRGVEPFAEAEDRSWKLFGGVELGRHLAIEAATVDLGAQRCCAGVADLGFASDVGGYSLAALGRWPVGRYIPFLKLGLLSWSEDGELVTLLGPSSRSTDGTDILVGAGLDVEFPARLGVRVDWERYDLAASDSVTVSLVVRFRR